MMRPDIRRLRGRLSRPLVIAASLYLVVGSAAASLVFTPAAVRKATPAKTASPLSEEKAMAPGAACPVSEKGQQGGVRLASAIQGEAEGESSGGKLNPEDYTEQPYLNPEDFTGDKKTKVAELLNLEFKNSDSCKRCHGGVEPSHLRPDNAGATCVGCHGGNGAATVKDVKTGKDRPLTKAEAHIMPKFPDRWMKAVKRGKKAEGPEDNDGFPVAHSGTPQQTYTLLNEESPEFIRFVNPGDLRIAHLACGNCHADEVLSVRKSMMTTGSMLYGAALYNNGVLPVKDGVLGESYSIHGEPQRIQGFFRDPTKENDQMKEVWRLPTPEETKLFGWLPLLDPLPKWNIAQPGNPFRVFERGGFRKRESDPGNPLREEESGKPDVKLSFRGYGTLLRTDPTVLGAQKTRLLDPTLNFPGTNDQPGDYRAGGCTACHNVYANDTSFSHSGPYSKYGHWGNSFTHDEALAHLSLAVKDGEEDGTGSRKYEQGHPIRHRMTSGPPTSQCISCHMHPGTNMLTTYLGYTWWDNETDGEKMYPRDPKDPNKWVDARRTGPQIDAIQRRNPEGAAAKGNWGDVDFLGKTGSKEFNKDLKHTQFADFHGHGWVYRSVFKRDRKGNLLDKEGNKLSFNDKDKFEKAVHLQDIHLEKGMHCVDCHFDRDTHGTQKLFTEPRAAIEIDCVDCHGSVTKKADLVKRKDDGTFELNEEAATSGLAGKKKDPTYRPLGLSGRNFLAESKVPFRKPGGDDDDMPGQGRQWPRFEVQEDGTVIQYSAVLFDKKKGEPKSWKVPQIMDSLSPTLPNGEKNPRYNAKSARAKTMQRDNATWGQPVSDESMLAHSSDKMTCYACHSSWTSACFGCHLNMQANKRKPQLHYEGGLSRNWTSYNFQTLRDDLYMLGKDGDVTRNRVAPIRSSCAVLVSSQNANREWLYYQQQTVAANGMAGTAFSSYVPHTVRKNETKQCTDCHVSQKDDNNAWLANLMLLGSNSVNYVGRYAYVATGAGFEAVQVTERDEPPAVIGSQLHKMAYPELYAKHQKRGKELGTFHEHSGKTLDLQLRGEYLYAAEGERGMWVFDVANVDNKGFSERITTAPVSPLGQKFYVNTKYCTAVASPSTMIIDGTRTQLPVNNEQAIHPLYNYLYLADKYEGLVVVGPVTTLFDGNPTNNFINKRAATLTDERLKDANNIEIVGHYAYLTTARALVVVDINTPTKPRIVAEVPLNHPTSVQAQFHYAFVTDADGLKTLDITDLAQPKVVPGALVPFQNARNVYVVRTYAYVAAGEQGLGIVDVESPRQPKLDQLFNAGGEMDDVHDVKVAMTSNSLYAYVADGHHGLRVVELTAPDMTEGIYGFSPRPTPRLIATHETPHPALAVSEGLDRDRAVDESGNQLSVFGRRGARPFNLEERQRMYRLNDGKGEPFKVTDEITPPATTAAAPRRSDWGWAGTSIVLPLGMLGFLFYWKRRRARR